MFHDVEIIPIFSAIVVVKPWTVSQIAAHMCEDSSIYTSFASDYVVGALEIRPRSDSVALWKASDLPAGKAAWRICANLGNLARPGAASA
ncbi:MAG: hypothetical protein IIZ38_13000 [Sphingomonas sp.]|uniref:hypothetical protein n=1 Tax=Sphingomonas sp. TaxID=28214 RepID=UPI0025F89BF4|nr:hypothetical protein [Sphingomonas sp.]MBQ1499224.1 hypothetical protein [Sphingomonas sp.]